MATCLHALARVDFLRLVYSRVANRVAVSFDFGLAARLAVSLYVIVERKALFLLAFHNG